MPSANDQAFNEEDTPDDLKGPKSSKKKQKKKATKQKAADEYKDSSSEGPKLSPDLSVAASTPEVACKSSTDCSPERPAIADHSNPSLPPSPPPDILNGLTPEGELLDHLAVSYDKAAPVDNIVLSSEPSPPQDGVLAARDIDGANLLSQVPSAFNAIQNVSSLSSSPQGGIRLPPSKNQSHAYNTSPPAHTAFPSRERKSSMASPVNKPVPFYDTPLPHLPQRHFTRRPDMDFGLASPSDASITAGSKGYYCGFDSLEKANTGTSPAANNLVLVGTQCGLDVYRLLRHRSDIVGRLEGLPGAVIDAKMLPWTDRHDPFAAMRPLVMCVWYGPVDSASAVNDEAGQAAKDAVLHQTTVGIYSLATAELVCTLYTSPTSLLRRTASPTSIGNLKIAAEGRFVTIASGTSGEVYVFSPYTHYTTAEELPAFRCIAKFWTTINTCAMSTPDGQTPHQEEVSGNEVRTPVCALSQRWLAIKPPLLSSAQISLQGTSLLFPKHPNPLGVSSHVSPPPPAVNCEVNAPFNNTLLDRMTKQATQEISTLR